MECSGFIGGWTASLRFVGFIVDDVCTTGDSIIKACEKAEEGAPRRATFCGWTGKRAGLKP